MSRYEFPESDVADPLLLEDVGPLLPVTLTVPIPRKRYLEQRGLKADAQWSGYALIDTGAAVSGVSERVMRQLEIPSIDEVETTTPHGEGWSRTYNASASFPDIDLPDVPLEHVLGCYLGEPQPGGREIGMLRGRDLLRGLVVTYDGPNSRVVVTT